MISHRVLFVYSVLCDFAGEGFPQRRRAANRNPDSPNQELGNLEVLSRRESLKHIDRLYVHQPSIRV